MLFGGVLELLKQVYPTAMPSEWWASTCREIEVTTVRLHPVIQCLSYGRLLGQQALESASWLGPALETAVHLCAVNASAGLSAGPTMNLFLFTHAFRLLESAARVASHANSLLDTGVIEALDYACLNDFRAAE